MREHLTDPYVQEAQKRGYRSRAAFKLLELAERDQLFRPGITRSIWAPRRVAGVRCCASASGPKATIVAVDLLPMDGMAGVRPVAGRFRDRRRARWPSRRRSTGRRPRLVVSDMAPNLSGIDAVDQARSVHLAEMALEFACQHLQPGGDFAVKVVPGQGSDEFQRAVQAALCEGLCAQAEGFA